jgi:RNA polymerase sigma-70 factor (ECF subfamily)
VDLDTIEQQGGGGCVRSGVRRDRFEQVVAELGPALARLTVGYERDAERRRDLLQEIHFAVWRSLATFDARCSLRTWVLRVAHNTAVKYVLREKRRGFARCRSLDDVAETSGAANPEHDVHRAGAAERLTRLISVLKPLDRQVVLLFLEDLDGAQIAEVTGLSRNAVAVRLHRIKHLLRRMFAEGSAHV